MPTIYVYLGIAISFYSNDHLPIHVHGKYQGAESKAEIVFKDGVAKITISTIRGKKNLPTAQASDFAAFCEKYADDIVKKWTDFFVKGVKPKQKTITRKIR